MLIKLCSSLLLLLLFHLDLVRILEALKQPRLIALDIIPIPNANLPGSQPIFPTSSEQRMSRQPLDYLSDELSRTQGQSSIAQRSKHDLKAYLSPDVVTDL